MPAANFLKISSLYSDGSSSHDGYTRGPAASDVMAGNLNVDILLSDSEWSEHGTFVNVICCIMQCNRGSNTPHIIHNTCHMLPAYVRNIWEITFCITNIFLVFEK